MTRRATMPTALGVLAALLAAWATPAEACPILLMEVLYDGAGGDADDAFTEIRGEAGLSLDGWALKGINGAGGAVYRTISLTGMTIPGDGLLVLATSSAAGAALAARDYTANVDWQNGPDAVQLYDAEGSLVDALQYGDAGAYAAGEGAYAPDVLSGWSLTRNPVGHDSDDNASDFYATSVPTPGLAAPAPAPVPEPTSLALVGGGLVALLRLRHRRRDPRSATIRPQIEA